MFKYFRLTQVFFKDVCLLCRQLLNTLTLEALFTILTGNKKNILEICLFNPLVHGGQLFLEKVIT